MEINHGLLNNFSPKEKTFSFNFTEKTCYKLANGICALDQFKEHLYLHPSEGRGMNLNRCVVIHQFFHHKVKFNSMPLLIKHKCGHYAFSDGQHRTCVCGSLEYKLTITLYENDEFCKSCSPESNRNILKTF